MDQVGEIIGLVPGFLPQSDNTGVFRHFYGTEVKGLYDSFGKRIGRGYDRLGRLLHDVEHGLAERGLCRKTRLYHLIHRKIQTEIIVRITESPQAFPFCKKLTVSDHELNIRVSVFDQLLRQIIAGIIVVKGQKVGVDTVREMLQENGRHIMPDDTVLKVFHVVRLAGDQDQAGYIPADKLVNNLAFQLWRMVRK